MNERKKEQTIPKSLCFIWTPLEVQELIKVGIQEEGVLNLAGNQVVLILLKFSFQSL